MRDLLEFMLQGSNFSQVQLGAFLHTAEALKIRGLAESSDERKEQGGLNSISPLSALKSSLSGLGNIAMGGLGAPSILERPLVPQLLPHHPDKQGNPLTAPHHLPPHLVPPPLSLPGGTHPTPSQGVTGGPTSSSSSSSTSCSVTGIPSGPLPLTTTSQPSERPPRPEAPEHSPSPPPPLPPSKRIRVERKSPLDPPPEKNNHRDSTNGTTSSSTLTTTTTTLSTEENSQTVLKVRIGCCLLHKWVAGQSGRHFILLDFSTLFLFVLLEA
ncbi:protein mono-ADP-ribosyltransferase PARP4-like [Penaeus monodon]|uniref:protein mono-ADP-ribosyltransferase PARP4-like n=1 Tax=Penaeus monodon TaxID=6687 RepID=UPI0018A7C5CB|nr:protein mono-ADP-ribosyltransferase PARP4-like [Penaeus monodon]